MGTKSKKGARYVVRYEPIEDGWWLATVPQVPGCLTQGRSLRQARQRVREALALCVGDEVAERAELTDDVQLPKAVRALLGRARDAQGEADAARERAAKATAKVVARLLSRGISTRDAAELLGVSHQRVSQIAAETTSD